MNDFEDLLLGTTLRRKFEDDFPGDEFVTDEDWYRIELEAGKIYELSVMPESDFSPELSMFDNGSQAISTRDLEFIRHDGQNTTTYFRPQIAGYYFAKIYDPLQESDGYYTVSANEIVDLPAFTTTPARIRENGFYDREIQTLGDSDWFRVELTGQRSYQFHIAGSSFEGLTLSDPFLRIYDENANLLDFNDNASPTTTSSQLRFNAPATGTYFVSVADARNGTGSYRVSAQTLDDFQGNVTTRGRLNIRENQQTVVRGDLEQPADIDWFQVDLAAGRWYRFTVAGEGDVVPGIRLLKLKPGYGRPP